jgi:beta-aspartyl-dipeptidase (metallo-type)
MSDDRSSHPTKQELLRIIQQVRLGGFTSAKGGIMHVHLGALPTGIDLLLEIAREYPSLISYISPTHMGRTHELFLQAIDFARLGGMIDISTGGTKYCEPYLSVLEGLEAGIDIHQMTFSSDGNAGVRRRNAETGEDTYLVAPLHKNLEQVVCLIREAGLSPADAFSLITTNPARNMHLTGKGRIAEGGDADITLFDDQWKLQGVWARGVEMMREGVVLKKGNFES